MYTFVLCMYAMKWKILFFPSPYFVFIFFLKKMYSFTFFWFIVTFLKVVLFKVLQIRKFSRTLPPPLLFVVPVGHTIGPWLYMP